MKARVALFLIISIVIPNLLSCSKERSNQFEMPVEKVEVLKGFILQGLAISGTVKNGCVASSDKYIVKRDGENVLDTTARILMIAGESAPDGFKKAVKGDFASLYIPDAKPGDVKIGDIAISNTISCQED